MFPVMRLFDPITELITGPSSAVLPLPSMKYYPILHPFKRLGTCLAANEDTPFTIILSKQEDVLTTITTSSQTAASGNSFIQIEVSLTYYSMSIKLFLI